MTTQLTILATVFLLHIPWVVIAFQVFRERLSIERVAIGLAGGSAATITCGYFLASVSRLDLFPFLYGLLLLVAAVLFIRHRRMAGKPPGKTNDHMWLVVGLLLIVLVQAVPTLSSDSPLGWDPSFHSILAKKILDSSTLATSWAPFEEIGINYPQGLHVFIAVISRPAGVDVHQTIQSLHFFVQLVAALLVYCLTLRIFGDGRTALLSMMSYVFLCNWGSFFSYYTWGGLPTGLGSVFLLGIIWSILSGSGGRHLVLRVLLFGTLVLTHHLGAVIALSVMLFHVLTTLRHGRLDQTSRRFGSTILWALLAYSFFVVPYLLKGRSLFSTDVLRYYDEAQVGIPGIVTGLGPLALVCGLAGLILSRGRIKEEGCRFLFSWIVSLLVSFFFLDYIYRFVAWLLTEESFTALTPSRFLTVASYPLAIYCGYALSRGIDRVGKESWVMGILVVMMFVSAAPVIRDLTGREGFTSRSRDLGLWIRENSPQNAFIVYRSSAGPIEWMPYLTWRRSIYTPIPASEDRAAIRQKVGFFGPDQTEARIRDWLSERDLRGYLFFLAEDGAPALQEVP